MASDKSLSSNPAELESGDSARIIGVRFPGASRIHFCAADEDMRFGEWVAVATAGGLEPACVVIPADQIYAGEDVSTELRIERRLSAQDMADIKSLQNLEDDAVSHRRATQDEGKEIGGLGKSHRPPSGSRLSSSDLAVSGDNTWLSGTLSPGLEDARYRELKKRLPRLGSQVATSAGSGTVISLQTMKELVTIRVNDTGEDLIVSASEVMMPQDTSQQ